MASEELQQRYPNNKGTPIGNFELFETQQTTLNQFAEHDILQKKSYGEYKSQKPDGLVIQRDPQLQVIAIGEAKAPGAITKNNWQSLALDLFKTKMVPTNSRLGYLTDSNITYWLCNVGGQMNVVSREDGKSMPTKLDFSDPAFVSEFEYINSHLDSLIGIVKTPKIVNPEALAKEIWQTVWRLQADRPEDCLATFVEVFIFKFLDDLNLLGKVKGIDMTFLNLVDNIPADQSFAYYELYIRPHIKTLFPKGPDGYSIINGIVIQAANRDHNLIFNEILKKFKRFGSLRNTSPEFKSRLYETFLQESKTTTTFGQFFTPRKIVSAIHDLARIDRQTAGKKICDPSSGVGGFILEQMARNLAAQWTKTGNQLTPTHEWSALELVPKTAILAKANALVYCGDLLASQPALVPSFAAWLNTAFQCKDKTSFGSLEDMSHNQYDIILTNPPFVVSGSADMGKLIKSDNIRKTYYSQKCSGLEGLFIQFIVKSLKTNGHAWILLPETFFLRSNDRELRRWLFANCRLDLLALLPERTFFNTPKRVAIVHLSRRETPLAMGSESQTLNSENVLLYAIGEIGETRDAKRLPIVANDLPNLVKAYRLHDAGCQVADKRAIIVKADDLFKQESINIRHYWPQVDARALGLLGEEEDPCAAKARIDNQVKTMLNLAAQWSSGGAQLVLPPTPASTRKVKIEEHCILPSMLRQSKPITPKKSKKNVVKSVVTLPKDPIFELSIGKRVLKKDIHQKHYGIPLFSANVRKQFGTVAAANAGGLEFGGALWSIDSDFDCKPVSSGEIYSITDHCGQMKILVPGIDPSYLAAQIKQAGLDYGFNREFRPSLEMIGKLEIELPVDLQGNFDLALMEQWTAYRMEMDRFNQEIFKLLQK